MAPLVLPQWAICTNAADCRHPEGTLPYESHQVYERLEYHDPSFLLENDYCLVLQMDRHSIWQLGLRIVTLLEMHKLQKTASYESEEMAILVLDTVFAIRHVSQLFDDDYLNDCVQAFDCEAGVYVEKVLIGLVIKCQLFRIETEKLSKLVTNLRECAQVVAYSVSGQLNSFLLHTSRTIASYQRAHPDEWNTRTAVTTKPGAVRSNEAWALADSTYHLLTASRSLADKGIKPCVTITQNAASFGLIRNSLYCDRALEQDAKIHFLRGEVERRDKEIETLEAQFNERGEKITSLNNRIKRRDDRIVLLENHIVRLTSDNADLGCSLAETEDILEGDQIELETSFAQIDSLSKTVTRRLLENPQFRSKFGLNRKRKRQFGDDA